MLLVVCVFTVLSDVFDQFRVIFGWATIILLNATEDLREVVVLEALLTFGFVGLVVVSLDDALQVIERQE